MKRKILAASLLASAALMAAYAPAAAQRYGHTKVLGYVTAHSHHGNGSIRAPYRDTPVGYQIRLPRGTWVYCRTSCAETLRVNTVDVWAQIDDASPIGVGTLQAECGIAGCLRWEWGF